MKGFNNDLREESVSAHQSEESCGVISKQFGEYISAERKIISSGKHSRQLPIFPGKNDPLFRKKWKKNVWTKNELDLRVLRPHLHGSIWKVIRKKTFQFGEKCMAAWTFLFPRCFPVLSWCSVHSPWHDSLRLHQDAFTHQDQGCPLLVLEGNYPVFLIVSLLQLTLFESIGD